MLRLLTGTEPCPAVFFANAHGWWAITWDGAWVWKLAAAAPNDEGGHWTEAEALAEMDDADREAGELWAEQMEDDGPEPWGYVPRGVAPAAELRKAA
jgi:hypothetical protein